MAANPYETVGDAARAYTQVRPAYPPQFVTELVTAAARTKNTPISQVQVCDIGAGTGKLTAQVAATGAEVWAVEPAADMRTELSRELPDFPLARLLATTAEHTDLPTAAFDLLTYGQCWHWLSAPEASAEAARILRPGGQIAIFFNQLDVRQGWVKRLSRIMRSGDVHRLDRPPQLKFPDGSTAFTDPQLSYTVHIEPMTVEQIFALGTTRASWLRSTADNRARMRENLRWYLVDHLGHAAPGRIGVPYISICWRAQLR
ncbi:MAG: class I SAM-dependent methyltransferase [Trueperella sp.]|nr:class I SAM-dependent methyltransferase [Trueperella sp.]